MSLRPRRAFSKRRFPSVLALVSEAGFISFVLGACASSPPDSLAQRGHELAREYGCISCHTSDGSESVGPTWKALYGSEVELDDGKIVVADRKYLEQSILMPSAQTVKGFEKGLMETVIKPNSVSEADVKALIAYIKTLR